ncbi:DUF4012 domain-containing protein [Bifidobacterium sp. ESL0769]|uniref:DUF4012 domain-containing protein n=1 Tax=Bifidobacterium sp. ESL0769 TaxID=2983229 RepID=UPI0023FA330F|nr:DUF4012 domain-containing protein [Bifidobacterium sp. ESL0769]WEV67733.1 DUF4012 domain-containing protein [Bifidobacterium sp. ESL0769]
MREPRGKHIRASMPIQHHHIWAWVLLVIFVLLLVVAGIGGYCAKVMYSQAKEVKTHEQNAISMLSGFSGSNDLNALDQVSQKLPQVQNETQKANDIAHGILWNVAAKAPVVGDDIKTVQGMTSSVDGIVHDSVPQFIQVFTSLKSANLSAGDGKINLQPIIQAQKTMKQADASMQTQVVNYRKLPGKKARIGEVRDAYAAGNIKLNALAKKVDQLSGTFQIVPDFLGANQPHYFAMMNMTTSEARSAGGLVGSVGLMTTNNGQISIGDFQPNTAYFPYGNGEPTADEQAMFHDWGPLNMSFDIRDLAVYPDNARTAQSMQAIWNRTPWGKKQPIDGVVMVDPVFLQKLIAVNGNVKLSDGRVLTGTNTAEFLLNTIYKDYSSKQQDAYFDEVSTQAVGSMFKGLNFQKLIRISTIIGDMAKNRHFSIYSFDQTMEQNFNANGYTASSPSNEMKPEVGVYVTQQNASKMDWYIHRTSTITKISGGTAGQQTYHVEYTMTNTLTREQLATLPAYIVGFGQAGQSQGHGVEKTLIYGPAGGLISNLQVKGTASTSNLSRKTMDSKSVYATVADLAPGTSAIFTFDVTTSSKSTTQLDLDQTPMGWDEPGVKFIN